MMLSDQKRETFSISKKNFGRPEKKPLTNLRKGSFFPIFKKNRMSFRILKARSKAALRNIFDKHPMLDGLFAQMLYEPRFRVLFGLTLVFLATLPFLLFPLIKASPEGFNPPLRVS